MPTTKAHATSWLRLIISCLLFYPLIFPPIFWFYVAIMTCSEGVAVCSISIIIIAIAAGLWIYFVMGNARYLLNLWLDKVFSEDYTFTRRMLKSILFSNIYFFFIVAIAYLEKGLKAGHLVALSEVKHFPDTLQFIVEFLIVFLFSVCMGIIMPLLYCVLKRLEHGES